MGQRQQPVPLLPWAGPFLYRCLPHSDQEGTSYHYTQGVQEPGLSWEHFLPVSMATLFSATL